MLSNQVVEGMREMGSQDDHESIEIANNKIYTKIELTKN